MQVCLPGVCGTHQNTIRRVLTSHQGTESDDTIQIDGGLQGEVLVLGDAKEGIDRLAIGGTSQHLNFVTQPQNGIRNLEFVDLRRHGGNRLRLDAASTNAVSGAGQVLKVYHDTADQVLLQGDWAVQRPGTGAGGSYHVATSDDAIVHLFNELPAMNPLNRYDVDRSGSVSALDALVVINWLSRRQWEAAQAEPDGLYVDVSGDNRGTALDALQVINELVRPHNRESEEQRTQPIGAAFPLGIPQSVRADAVMSALDVDGRRLSSERLLF